MSRNDNENVWNRAADKFEEYRSSAKITPLFEEFLQLLKPNAMILDIGCGPGLPFTKALVENKFDVIGLDIAKDMIKKARKNVPGAIYINKSMTEMRFQQKFGGIVSSYSLNLIEPRLLKGVLRSIAYSLEQKGYFYLSLNEPEDDNPDTKKYLDETMMFKDYSEEEILQISSKYRFQVIKISKTEVNSEAFGKEKMMEIIFQR